MQRYFISSSNWSEDGKVVITGDDVHHIVRVMRMDVDDEIICTHPNGEAAICKIIEISSDKVFVNIVNWKEEQVELPIHVTIAQGLPKADKLELILQKGTELGANKFIPFQASRSIVKWDQKKADKKIERFNKIVKEASEQSHRTRIPHVKSVYSFQKLLEESKDYDVKLFAFEEETRSKQSEKLSHIFDEIKLGQSVIACIGPEGGFALDEVTLLKEYGFSPVRLGPRILRTETAPLYFLSSISYHFEELR
ncbi:16S rRNA (uracil(1498)-N(3))-methyltransferase [Aquibacillus rhizosphaerae]|uniref:Ribosomal RNA small subunit methyltransferase E n=1 Tax=Aquibacillus rhizosphaerae TaxID=3051431 RepID=A0ABT7L6K3_9BACI|nr:16S rRNA (uracil(1498)-N(3))-methyltransferase [Aquibacillus sp. LR5S19]MDL4841493.1 16S rRNA (uracil(1498)-N(3))-methyltransferase [Aquibacillus sp. LR5S19]